jgi:aspartate 1-decarboxylase
MLREMLQGKIHNAVVTSCQVDYPGSLEVDVELIERAGMLVHQKIQLLDCTNGARMETYLIAGERGARRIGVKGAAARLVNPGDKVIIIAYAMMNEAEIADFQPTVLVMGPDNEIIEELKP